MNGYRGGVAPATPSHNRLADARAMLPRFLEMIAGRSRFSLVEIRYFPGPKQEWLPAADADAVARRIIELDERGHEVYVGAVPRCRDSGGKDACGPARVLWVDCDTWASVDRLLDFTPAPTLTVCSGGIDPEEGTEKVHAWWALREPLEHELAERALRRLAHHLGSDPAVAEVARVMRPPGTTHRKGGEPRPVTVEDSGFVGHARTAVDVVGLLDDPPRPTRPAATPQSSTSLRSDDDPLRDIPAATYVPLLTGQQLGRDGKVQCPFHEDWNPSLHAYDSDGGWYCFQCREGGSIIDLGARLYGIEPRGRGFHDIRRRLAADLLGSSPP